MSNDGHLAPLFICNSYKVHLFHSLYHLFIYSSVPFFSLGTVNKNGVGRECSELNMITVATGVSIIPPPVDILKTIAAFKLWSMQFRCWLNISENIFRVSSMHSVYSTHGQSWRLYLTTSLRFNFTLLNAVIRCIFP